MIILILVFFIFNSDCIIAKNQIFAPDAFVSREEFLQYKKNVKSKISYLNSKLDDRIDGIVKSYLSRNSMWQISELKPDVTTVTRNFGERLNGREALLRINLGLVKKTGMLCLKGSIKYNIRLKKIKQNGATLFNNMVSIHFLYLLTRDVPFDRIYDLGNFITGGELTLSASYAESGNYKIGRRQYSILRLNSDNYINYQNDDLYFTIVGFVNENDYLCINLLYDFIPRTKASKVKNRGMHGMYVQNGSVLLSIIEAKVY